METPVDHTTTTAADASGGTATHELGPVVRTYGSGFYSTWLLVLLGAFIILSPVLVMLGVRAEGKSGGEGALLVEIVFLPVGLFTIWRGLRQRAASLTIRESGFEYSDGTGQLRVARYSDVEKLVLRSAGGLPGSDGAPDAMAVHLKDGSSFTIKCIEAQGVKDGYNEIERRL